MEKELTPLEALEEIKHTTNLYMPNELNGYKEELDIIETALKDYEELKSRENNVLPNDEFIGDLGEHTRDEVAIKLKALEIIKEKRVNVDNFLNHIRKDTNYKEYKRLCGLYKIMVFSDKELTKQEYDLLKGELL